MNLRFLPLLALVAFGLLGCVADTKTDATAEGVDFKRTSNEVSIALQAEPTSLNPILSTQSITRYVAEQIFQTLNDQDPKTFEQVPLLASTADIEEAEDGTVSYTYEIDEDATWPNGSAVTAADVIFSLKTVLNPLVEAGPYRPYYSMISDITVDPEDEQKFTVYTKRPYLLSEQAIGSLYIYPEYAYDPDGTMADISLSDFTDTEGVETLAESDARLKEFADFFNDPDLGRNPERIVGSGPYRVTSWEEGQRLRLERRDDYWGSDRKEDWLASAPEALEFNIITDNTTIGNALRDEAVDVVIDLPVDQFQEMREDEYLSQRFDFESVPSFKYFGILLNQSDPLVADQAVRRALAHSVNVDQIIEQLFPGLAERVVGPVLPAKNYYNNDLEPIPFDPEEASRLLEQAGWTDTNGDGTVDKEIDGQRRELSFQLLSFPSPTSEAVSLIAAEGAKLAGIDIEVVKQEPRAMFAELNKGNFTASIVGHGTDPAPDDFTQVWASTSVPPNGTNRSSFSNSEADELLKTIASTTDPAQRKPLYGRFQKIIYDNQPMIFLFSPSDRVVVSKRFEHSTTSMAPNLSFNALELRD